MAVRLTQPDGGSFLAVAWGDGRNHGIETLQGYTVVRDRDGIWRYATGRGASGRLLVGASRPDRHQPPSGVEPGQRPEDPPAPSSTQPDQPGVEDPPDSPAPAPLSESGAGQVPWLVILGEYGDRPHQTGAAYWSDRFFGPGDSVRSYYRDGSFAQLDLVPAAEGDAGDGGAVDDGVVGWVDLGATHPDTGEAIDHRNVDITRAAITAAEPRVDFASFDTDGNGSVDPGELHITVVVAGYERSYSPTPCGQTIWAHRWRVHDSSFEADGKRIGYDDYTQFGELHCSQSAPSQGHPATVGIMVHEIGHSLGWPDLYDVDEGDEGAGDWSVMATGSWNRAPASPTSA